METYIEEHTVQIERAKATGRLVRERHLFGSVLHHDGRAALHEYDPETGTLIKEGWYQNGQLCREDGPAQTVWSPQEDVVTFQVWRTGKGLHREGGSPAKISRDATTGIITCEEFYENDRHHNAHGPAVIVRDSKIGTVIREDWYQHGQLTREGGLPAVLVRDARTGITFEEEYWIDGELHRVGGPALIERDRYTGEVTVQEFAQRGQPKKPPSPSRDWTP